MGFALILGVCLSLNACAPTDFDAAGTSSDLATLNALQPYVIEVCAVSEMKKKAGFGFEYQGGTGGHAVLFLRGACRVDDAGYPMLRVCDPDEIGQDTGVGVSANSHFSNANWVATPGRDFFFNGGVGPREKLTRERYVAAQTEARRRRILDGVRFHDEVFADMPGTMTRDDYMYEVSTATDYAIAFGRGRFCARQPVTQSQMARAVHYLNDLNGSHRSGHNPFQMTVLDNNCSHLTHNTLAAAGVWDQWPTGQFILFAAFSFPVPKNEFVNQMRRSNDLTIDDPSALFDDVAARHSLLRDRWLPATPGVIATSAPPLRDNDLYDTSLSLIFYDAFVLSRYARWFDAILTEPRYTDPRANARYFAAVYDHVGNHLRPVDWWLARRGGSAEEQAAFREFYRQYEAMIIRMRQETATMSARLDRTYVARAGLP